jgi:septal ring factor EnvC (AmiA/AmiB activator)
MPDGLWGILIPVIAATVILVGGAFVVRSYAGPGMAAAQAATRDYTSAMEGRMKALMSERDDLARSLAGLTDEVKAVRDEVLELQRTIRALERQVRDLTAENMDLLRQLRAKP